MGRLARLPVVVALAALAGFALASGLATRRSQGLERANQELRAALLTLEEGLRDARSPLQRRIHELETERAAARSGPDSAPALAARSAHLEAELDHSREENRELAAERDALATRLAGLTSAKKQPSLAKRATTSRPRKPTPRKLPAVAAAPPQPVCPPLEEPGFVLKPGSPLRRLGGHLELELEADRRHPKLRIASHPDLYDLAETPRHIQFECGGESYVVSVCRVSRRGRRAKGTIWLPDSAVDPCS